MSPLSDMPTVYTLDERFTTVYTLNKKECAKLTHSFCWLTIRAPLTGCDLHQHASRRGQGDFNPRTPYGIRPRAEINLTMIHLPSRLTTLVTTKGFCLIPEHSSTKIGANLPEVLCPLRVHTICIQSCALACVVSAPLGSILPRAQPGQRSGATLPLQVALLGSDADQLPLNVHRTLAIQCLL